MRSPYRPNTDSPEESLPGPIVNPLGSVLLDFLTFSLVVTLLLERITGDENCLFNCGVEGPLDIMPSDICFLYIGFACDDDLSGFVLCLLVDTGSDIWTFGWRGRNIRTGPKCAWYEIFAFPEMIGTPSRRGSGMVSAIPTLVPTQSNPLAAARAVT